jgi:MFS family permease
MVIIFSLFGLGYGSIRFYWSVAKWYFVLGVYRFGLVGSHLYCQTCRSPECHMVGYVIVSHISVSRHVLDSCSELLAIIGHRYCVYVGCFWVATRQDAASDAERLVAYTGAAIGGVGAGFLWTAQGAYFAMAAEEHAQHLQQAVSTSTASLAGRFAFLYLAEEVVLRVLSTVLVGILSWESIFGLYTAITVVSTLCMPFVYNYPPSSSDDGDDTAATSTIFYKVTAAGQLLWKDPKMKYMIGLNAVFGFAAAFLNSYVNGQVVPIALENGDKYIGVLSSWVSAVAAGMSLVFGRLGPTLGKGPILMLGAVCFFGVVFPFVVQPDASQYGWGLLIMVYSFHGIGRATFEGTLKATFADYFAYEKEGAFANIILQNGLSGAIGYFCKYCTTRWPYYRLVVVLVLVCCSALNPLALTHISLSLDVLLLLLLQ